MNQEAYSYIVSSIDLLNKSLKIQDHKTVQLFSYMYDKYANMQEQINHAPSNNDIQLLSYCIVNLDQRFQKIEFRMGKIDKKIDKIISYINDNNENKIIVEKDNKPNIVIQLYNNICIFLKFCYGKIYQLIFRRRIQRQLEAERQKIIEQEKQKRLEKQKIIKNILEKNK